MEPTEVTSSWKFKGTNKCNLQHPTLSARTVNNCFATTGGKTYNEVKQRQQISGLDVKPMHERTNPRITKKTSLWSSETVQAADVTLALSKLKNTNQQGTIQLICNISKKVFWLQYHTLLSLSIHQLL